MKCGEFPAKAKDKVVIQSVSEAADAYGGFTTTWSTLATVWAYIQPVGGRELYTNEKRTSRVTHKVVIRYLASITQTDTAGKYRVTFDSRTLPVDYIENLDEDMKSYGKVYQRLHCVENGEGND